ncbi:MAG: phosphoglucosamine mutase [Leptospiraceae bacterium]|nr:phosphoglucosamine mutase [Leptospiraceae bacterium]
MIKEIHEHLDFDFLEQIKKGNLMISISGIRAKLPEGLNLNMILKLIETYVLTSGTTIVLGNDGRGSSLLLSSFIEGILYFYGKRIINVGIAPTPTIKATCNLSKADGGIIITASHNPSEWNGIKFLKKGGDFFENEDYLNLFINFSKKPKPKEILYDEQLDFNGIEAHIQSIIEKLPNLEQIQKQSYTVLIDPVNASGIYVLPKLLEILKCRVISIHDKRSKTFQRPPEPTPKALSKFSSMLQKTKASVGFALDPDGDRLVIGSPTKKALNEEYTLPLAYLGKKMQLQKNSKFVINYSTSKALEKIASVDGHQVYRAPVGEANVVKKMRELKSQFGGEGNGGAIDLSIPSKGRDSLVGVAYVLSAMAEKNANTIDELLNILPDIHIEKLKIPYEFDKKDKIVEEIKEFVGNYPSKELKNFSKEDGYFFEFKDDSWIHVRLSNTEPIIRIIFEANTKKELQEIKNYISKKYTQAEL